MESIVFIDTHVVIWLYAGSIDLLSKRVKKELQRNDILISPIVRLELQYLKEIGRITETPEKIIDSLKEDIGLKESDSGFTEIVQEAVKLSWTRDPFDRIITGQSSICNAKLLTKDTSILSNYDQAIWD